MANFTKARLWAGRDRPMVSPQHQLVRAMRFAVIHLTTSATPTPSLSPQGGGEQVRR
jgi:hypothetical protein